MIKPWVISVISTDYDLHDCRENIINDLKRNNIKVSAFELPDFPVEPNISSHDSCLKALERADIALLIIDKRYGGIYSHDDYETSITQEEYLSIVKQSKPYFVFVSKQTWDERHKYKEAFKKWTKDNNYTEEQIKEGFAKSEFDKIYTVEYVDCIATIDFVEEIQNAYKNYGRSNWIVQYECKSDLLEKVIGKLKGHTRFVLKRLVSSQKQNLEKRHTSTGLSLSLGDVFSRGYYLEPSYNIESGNLYDGTTLDQKIQSTLLENRSILVFGEAGYGKTTILAKSYLNHTNNFFKEVSYQIPFYLWLKKKNKDYHFDFKKYVDESFVDDCNMEPYPYLDLSSIRPYFYFDGFDEIAEKMTPDDIERISQNDIFSHPIILTCRLQYALRYINNFSFSDKFDLEIKINIWTTEMARKYIENFCKINNKDLVFADTIHKLLIDNQDMQDILDNPLMITMLLWVVEQNKMQVPETIHTRVQLFNKCLFELAKRELVRLKQSESYAESLIHIWAYASWEFYYNKLRDISTQMSTLSEKINDTNSLQFTVSPTYFEALFDSAEDKVFGTFHDQFLEFLVAKIIQNACLEEKYPYPEFLSCVIRPEINRYFRTILKESSQETKQKIFINLQNQYYQCFTKNPTSFDSIAKRVHAVYHIMRINTSDRTEFLLKAFEIEKNISVLLSLYFGAIKMGDLKQEQCFYDLLISDHSYNEANRGYHITYYSDAIMGTTWPFPDDKKVNWNGTLRAFMRHFNSIEIEHYYLRRIDLITMQHLIEARGHIEPLTNEHLEQLEHLVKNPKIVEYPEFQCKILNEFDKLKTIWIKYNH